MSTITVRITQKTHLELRLIAEKDGASIQNILDRLVSDYRRRTMLEEGNRAYAALREDPKAWAKELDERAIWHNTIADGLGGVTAS